jgi:hypothetical protein
MTPRQAAVWSLAAIAMAACSSATRSAASDPSPGEPRAVVKPPPTRSIDHPTGTTESGSQGTVSGSMTTTPTPEKEQQRGNTPPGQDREGHGPAAGAIVDPSGAATGRKPF